MRKNRENTNEMNGKVRKLETKSEAKRGDPRGPVLAHLSLVVREKRCDKLVIVAVAVAVAVTISINASRTRARLFTRVTFQFLTSR